MADGEFEDLTVTIELSHQDASDVANMVEAVGNQDDQMIVDAIRYAIRQAVKQRREQDQRAPAR